MADAFISYARDERDKAEKIKEALEQLGLSTFFDIDGGIDAGDSFPARITEALRSSRVVVACWSQRALARDWVRRESMMARDLGKLVAVAIDSLRPTDLPSEFYDTSFEDLSSLDVSSKHWGWSQTLNAIARRIEASTEANPSDAENDRLLNLALVLRKASLTSRPDSPQSTGSVTVASSAPTGVWARVQSSFDVEELRRFADSFPGSVESFHARERIATIETEQNAVEEDLEMCEFWAMFLTDAESVRGLSEQERHRREKWFLGMPSKEKGVTPRVRTKIDSIKGRLANYELRPTIRARIDKVESALRSQEQPAKGSGLGCAVLLALPLGAATSGGCWLLQNVILLAG